MPSATHNTEYLPQKVSQTLQTFRQNNSWSGPRSVVSVEIMEELIKKENKVKGDYDKYTIRY